MNQTIEHETAVSNHTDDAVHALHCRAEYLRRQARAMHPLVGKAYRRRAAELELGAWALAIRSGRTPVESRTTVAA